MIDASKVETQQWKHSIYTFPTDRNYEGFFRERDEGFHEQKSIVI